MTPEPDPPGSDEAERTGLPWPATWRAVYGAVFALFVLWVALLSALAYAYR
jgi:hypothetical protein